MGGGLGWRREPRSGKDIGGERPQYPETTIFLKQDQGERLMDEGKVIVAKTRIEICKELGGENPRTTVNSFNSYMPRPERRGKGKQSGKKVLSNHREGIGEALKQISIKGISEHGNQSYNLAVVVERDQNPCTCARESSKGTGTKEWRYGVGKEVSERFLGLTKHQRGKRAWFNTFEKGGNLCGGRPVI